MITSTNRNNPSANTTAPPVKFLSTSQQDQKILKKKFNYSSQQFDDALQNNSDLDDYTSLNENTLRNLKHQKQYKSVENSFDQPSFTASYNDSNKTENIFYVKQKYKMYLDWLDENYNSNSKASFQHTNQKPQVLNIKSVNNNFFNNILKPPVATATTQITSTQSSVDVSNLNWYKFETSLLSQNQNQQKTLKPRSPKNDYFSNLTNKIHQNRQQHQQQQNIFESLISTKSNQLPQILIPNKGKVLMKTKKSNNSSRVIKNDDSSNETSALSMNNPSSLSMNRNSSPDEYFENHVNNKAVKFDSNLLTDVKSPKSIKRKSTNTTSNSKTPQGTTPHLPLKPILKSTLNNDSIIKRQIANYSPTTTASSDYQTNNLESNDNRFNRTNFYNSNTSSKLPPLADSIKKKHNCSDDFLAVINDMEKSRLV
jgi:hypothetical protein